LATYRYLLTDIMSGRVISDALTLNVSSYARTLSASADCSCTLDLSEPNVWHLTDPIAATEPRRTALWIVRDEQLVWGGIIWTRKYSSGNNLLDLTASTPESYFARRRIRSTLTYTQVDQHTIAVALVNDAQAQAHGNIGVVVPTPAGSGRPPRDRTYLWHERATYLERIQQLAEVIDGPDFTIAPAWLSENVPGWYFNVGSPIGATKNILWEFPGDITSYSWPEDGGSSANFWSAIGAPDPTVADQTQAPPLIRDAQMPAEWDVGIPLLEDVSTHSDVTDVNTLAGYAQANVKAAAGNRTVPEITLRLDEGDEIPSLGDEAVIYITDPYRFPPDPETGAPGLATNVRVTAWSVSLQTGEPESVTLTVSEVV
jgi:hypothetical protein